MKGRWQHYQNVEVRVRVRPGSGERALTIDANARTVALKEKRFEFDHVYGEAVGQGEIYDSAVAPLVQGVLEGFNATVLAYGQTGSGKSYTMGCEKGSEGIVARALRDIIARASVRISYIEIYNEELRDLLAPKKRPCVRERVDGGVFVADASEVPVGSIDDIGRILERGAANRATEGTALNDASSRSHAVLTATVETRRSFVNNNEDSVADDARGSQQLAVVRSKMHMVDLAGSERARRSGAEGQRFKEGVHINAGLLALGKVISALCDAQEKMAAADDRTRANPVAADKLRRAAEATHVPYRDSKLTRLLQDSLGGRARTVMIACVSSEPSDAHETATTLTYASRARRIRNAVARNATLVLSAVPAAEEEALRGRCAALAAETRELKARLAHCSPDRALGVADAERELRALRAGLERVAREPSTPHHTTQSLREILGVVHRHHQSRDRSGEDDDLAAQLAAAREDLDKDEAVFSQHASRAEAAEAAFAALRAQCDGLVADHHHRKKAIERDVSSAKAAKDSGEDRLRVLDDEIASKRECISALEASEHAAELAVRRYRERVATLEREAGDLRERVRDGLAVGAVDESQQLRFVSKLGENVSELGGLRQQKQELRRVEGLRRESGETLRSLAAHVDQLTAERDAVATSVAEARALHRDLTAKLHQLAACPAAVPLGVASKKHAWMDEDDDKLEKRAARWLKRRIDDVVGITRRQDPTMDGEPTPYEALARLETDVVGLAPKRQLAVLVEACRQLVALRVARHEDAAALALARKMATQLRSERRDLKKNLDDALQRQATPPVVVQEYEAKIEFLLRELKQHETPHRKMAPEASAGSSQRGASPQ
ncbi:hypothetical protein CTAYLR_001972 [Chrysophaeum taylorii]|uniref:Kinesin-like protein n=1 Tax=Chrysophaeum taylorii TaxID=2483200 RepID=A0AAD7U968_9STRA|nr:hypothetical protein CTAYLR_001972 [Chrysophaeum taylorii]